MVQPSNLKASLKTFLIFSFVEHPDYFGGEELKVRLNQKSGFLEMPLIYHNTNDPENKSNKKW